eukprot:EG_transcript_6845
MVDPVEDQKGHQQAIDRLDEEIAHEIQQGVQPQHSRHHIPYPHAFNRAASRSWPPPTAPDLDPTPPTCAGDLCICVQAESGAAVPVQRPADHHEAAEYKQVRRRQSALVERTRSNFESIRHSFLHKHSQTRGQRPSVDVPLGSWDDWIYDDDDPGEDGSDGRPIRWQGIYAVFTLTHSCNKRSAKNGHGQVAGHASNFRREGGYILKALLRGEGTVLEALQKQPTLKPFVPQFMGLVERDDTTYVRMQDVLLSMVDPNLMDIKIGVRTFGEEEVLNPKCRPDLLQKALKIQSASPDIQFTEAELRDGITKFRFMELRDQASSSRTLGFRIQGMKEGHLAFGSKDFSTFRTSADYQPVFHSFFSHASPVQKRTLFDRLKQLEAVLAESEWFADHEFIGSSIFVAYDTRSPEKSGIWMIDFARTEPAPRRLSHSVPWTAGSHEDGYLIGLRSLLELWSEELGFG